MWIYTIDRRDIQPYGAIDRCEIQLYVVIDRHNGKLYMYLTERMHNEIPEGPFSLFGLFYHKYKKVIALWVFSVV